jgi:predicted nucleotidyltransferase
MDALADPALDRLVARAKHDPDVLAVLLFGSRARGTASSGSDIDECPVIMAEPRSDLAAARTRL